MITSYFPDLMASTIFSHTFGALISGFWSYVATSLGEGTRILSSPSFGSSTPPLKKNVTCAYFSVSAILACFILWAARYSPNVFLTSTFLNAINLLGIVTSYSVKHTNVRSNFFSLAKPSKSSAQKALVIWRARSGLKLQNTTESPSVIVATGCPSFLITVGRTNSSVTSLAYEFLIAWTGSVSSTPSPFVIATYAFSSLSQLLSLSIA